MDKALFHKLIIFNLFTSGFCAFTQLLLNTALSYVVSNTIIVYVLFTGLYLMSMGIGVFWVERMKLSPERLIKIIVRNSILAVFICNPGVLAVLYFSEIWFFLLHRFDIDLTWLTYVFGVILTIAAGMISGAELPLLSKIIEQKKSEEDKLSTASESNITTADENNDLNNEDNKIHLTMVLVSDYFGTSLGILIFAFVLFPFTGLIFSLTIAPLPMILAVIYIFFYLKYPLSRRLLIGMIIFAAYLTCCFLFRDVILQAINALSFL